MLVVRSVTDRSKAADAAAAATNNSGGGVRWPPPPPHWPLICGGQSNTATINKV